MKKLLLVLTVVAMASFLLVGCLPTTNTAPVITTTALPNATVEIAYTATVAATDADDDALTFSLVSGPTDMVISEAGVISGWTPAAEGTEAVTVAVTDGTDSVSADFTITIDAAQVTPAAPTITAIDDQEVAWDSAPWILQVEAAPGTGTITGYSLTGEPTTMTISAAGLITWTNIAPVPAVYAVTVRADASDGEYDTEAFVIEVTEPVVPNLVDTIVYDADYFYDDETTKFVRSGAVPVEVTLFEALVAGETLSIQWNDGSDTPGEWEELTLKDGTTLVYEGTVTFDGTALDLLCKRVCVEVVKKAACCDDVLDPNPDYVKVDSVDPYANLYLTFTDCTTECDEAPTSAKFSFSSTEPEDVCGLEEACCGDACSGFKSWSLEVIPATTCDPYCEFIDGTTCPVEGETACNCLDYAATATEGNEEKYEVKYILTDNVGNTFTDTWTITLDTDSVVSVVVPKGTDIADPVVFGTEYGIYTDKCAL